MANLLFVDDNAEAIRPMAMLFRLFSHQVDYVASGDEALAYIKNKMPDVVLLDVMMPGMDGMEVLRLIRGNKHSAQLPVIMYSAISDPAYRQSAMEKGANDYLVKGSVEIEDLRRRIEAAAAIGRALNASARTDANTEKPRTPIH